MHNIYPIEPGDSIRWPKTNLEEPDKNALLEALQEHRTILADPHTSSVDNLGWTRQPQTTLDCLLTQKQHPSCIQSLRGEKEGTSSALSRHLAHLGQARRTLEESSIGRPTPLDLTV